MSRMNEADDPRGARGGIAPAETATSRLELVWGTDGVERLSRATVAVFGAGGVGSNCLEALARGGIGTLVVVDGDEVAPSNINRQAIAFTSTVGRRKTDVAREMVRLINPGATVVTADSFVLPANLNEVLAACLAEIEDVRGQREAGAAGSPAATAGIDFIVDAIDTVSSKLALASWALEHGVPIISSMGGAGKVDPSLLRLCDVFETSHDPLARVMRKECRKRGIGRLPVLSSTEQVAPAAAATASPKPDEGAGADGERPPLGTVSYLPPIMGQMIAGYVIRNLVGAPLASDPAPLRG